MEVWTRHQTLNLIQFLQQCRCLYDPSDKYFRNKERRARELNYILTEMREIKPNVSMQCVKRKIKALQSQARKERVKVLMSQKNEAETGDVYIPQLWYYEKVLFLVDPNNESDISVSNFDFSVERQDNNDEIEEQTVEQTIEQNPNEKEFDKLEVWDRQHTLILIDLLEGCRCLYDPTDSNYSNKRKRSEDLGYILKNMRKVKPDITVNCIKKKIKTLRNQARREKAKALICRENEAVTGDIYKPSLWCYDKLRFLTEAKSCMKRSSSSLDYYSTEEFTEEVEQQAEEQTKEDLNLLDVLYVQPDEQTPKACERKRRSNFSDTQKEWDKFEVWDRQHTLMLIDLLEGCRCLYDPTDSNYSNKVKRAKDLGYILKNMRKVKPNITVNCIKKKIKTLRNQARREKARGLNSRENEAVTGDIYKPKLWCYDKLRFLTETKSCMKRSSSSLDYSTEEFTDGVEQQAEEQTIEEDLNLLDFLYEQTDEQTPKACERKRRSNFSGTQKEWDKFELWNKQHTLMLIDLLENCRCLYDVTDSNYNNKLKRAEDLSFISKEMKKVKPDITVNCIKKKIKTLQNQARREKARGLNSRDNEEVSGDIYEPKLWCYDKLWFLIERKSSTKRSSSSLDYSGEASAEMADHQEEEQTVEEASHFVHASNQQPEEQTQKPVAALAKVLDQKAEKESPKACISSSFPELKRRSNIFSAIDNTNSERNTNSNLKKRKIENLGIDIINKYEEAMEKIQSLTKQPSVEESVFLSFGKNIGMQLQNLPPEKAYTAMAELQTVISRHSCEALQKEKSEESFIQEINENDIIVYDSGGED